MATQVLGQNFKMVLLAKERRQIGGERIDELLPLRPIVNRLQPVQIAGKALMSCLAQATGQTAVDHGVLAIVQADPSALINQRLHTGKVCVGPDKFTPLGQRARGRRRCGICRIYPGWA